jgi:hypothetical protein
MTSTNTNKKKCLLHVKSQIRIVISSKNNDSPTTVLLPY